MSTRKQELIIQGTAIATQADLNKTKNDIESLIGNIKQQIYDGIFPIGTYYINFYAPSYPEGVSCHWIIQNGWNGRALWLNSNEPLFYTHQGSIPKPQIMGNGTHHHDMYSAFTPNHSGTSGWGTYAGNGAAAAAGTTYDAGLHSHAIGDTGPYVDLTEDWEVRPTSLSIKMWKRVSPAEYAEYLADKDAYYDKELKKIKEMELKFRKGE